MKKGIDVLLEAARFWNELQKADSKAKLSEVQASMIDDAIEEAKAEGYRLACQHLTETSGKMDE